MQWAWRLSGLAVWLLPVTGCAWLKTSVGLAFLILWMTAITRLRVPALIGFCLYLLMFPLVLLTMPLWLGKRSEYIVERSVGYVPKRGLTFRKARRWVGYLRVLWAFEVAALLLTWNTNGPWGLSLTTVLGLMLLGAAGLRCMALVTEPDPRDFFPDWPLVVLLWWSSSISVLNALASETTGHAALLIKRLGRAHARLSAALATRAYAAGRYHHRSISAATGLVEQALRAAAALSALVLGGSTLLRMAVGPRTLNSMDAVGFVAGALFSGGSPSISQIPEIVQIPFSFASWLILAVFVLPLMETFTEWRDHRSVQLRETMQVFVRSDIEWRRQRRLTTRRLRSTK